MGPEHRLPPEIRDLIERERIGQLRRATSPEDRAAKEAVRAKRKAERDRKRDQRRKNRR